MTAGLNSPALARGFSSLNAARLVPEAIIGGHAASAAVASGEGRWLAGGPLAFTRVRLLWRADPSSDLATEAAARLDVIQEWATRTGDSASLEVALERLSAARQLLADHDHRNPRIVGVLNVTPDSFSDGGKFETTTAAIDHGLAMIDAGADFLDIGGESTRPGADDVSPAAQCRRILPVIAALVGRVPLSVDTRSAEVMCEALKVGVAIVNDVSALTGDPNSLAVVAEAACPVILMHSLSSPKTMQQRPNYRDVRLDIYTYLEDRIAACVRHGIARDKVIADPGIGFGQNDRHIALLMRDLAVLHGLGCPLMLGASRKSFIARMDRDQPAEQRIGGSIAAALLGVAQGVQYLRVHDVAETRQALAVWTHCGGSETLSSN